MVQILHLNVYQCKKLEARYHQHAGAGSFASEKLGGFLAKKRHQKATKLIEDLGEIQVSEPVCCEDLMLWKTLLKIATILFG